MKKEQKILKKNGHLIVPFPEELKYFASMKIMDSWKEFVKQKLRHKKMFKFDSTGGYKFKGQKDRDYKENFHFSLSYFPPERDDFFLTPVDMLFLKNAKMLLEKSVETVYKIGDLFGDGLAQEMLEDKNQWTVRFLYCPSRQVKPYSIILASHVDKGVTLHLAEDKEGLEVL